LRPENDAVVGARTLEEFIGKRRAVLLERSEADIVVIDGKAEIEARVGRLQNGKRG
jgi:hypothetical protein